MMKREHLNSITDPALKVTAAKFLDKMFQSGKYHEQVFTAFLSPLELSTCEKLYHQSHENMNFAAFGGHESTEYQMIGLSPSYLPLETSDFPIQLIVATVRAKTHDLSHRDVLGALMSLGFQRNRIGDLWISENDIQILCDTDMAGYITGQLEKIGRYTVDCELKQLDQLRLPEIETEESFKTVPSLRLDAILAAGFNLSRSSALELIQGEKVKLNHLPMTHANHLLKEGDLVACRGKGRMILSAIEGVSKKDRIKIRIKKMC